MIDEFLWQLKNQPGGGHRGCSEHACLCETELHLHQDVNTRQSTQLNATLITLYVFASVAADGCVQDTQMGNVLTAGPLRGEYMKC